MSEGAERAREDTEAAIAAWNREGLEAWAEDNWHPEIVWEEPVRFPDSGVHRGREACLRRMEERFALVGEVELEAGEVRTFGNLRLVELTIRGRGPASGAPVAMSTWCLFEGRDGKIVRWREFLDREEAVAAANADEPVSPDR